MIDRYFFVDYENVNHEGLNGITKLTDKDCVIIYYSENAKTMTFDLHRRINESKANFEYIKIDILIKNAIDCKILFDIKEISKSNKEAEFLIVSKDGDYDKTISHLVSQGYNVRRIVEVSKLVKKEEELIRSFFEKNIKETIYIEKKEEIIDIILKSNSKLQINNELMKYFSSEVVSRLYKKIKPLIKDLPGK